MTALEQLARERWIGWGDYAGYTTCSCCHEFVYCRWLARGRLCLTCFDLR
jgi:hypothetical protein